MFQKINRGPWTLQEDQQVEKLIAEHGTSWSLIAAKMPGRFVFFCWKPNSTLEFISFLAISELMSLSKIGSKERSAHILAHTSDRSLKLNLHPLHPPLLPHHLPLLHVRVNHCQLCQVCSLVSTQLPRILEAHKPRFGLLLLTGNNLSTQQGMGSDRILNVTMKIGFNHDCAKVCLPFQLFLFCETHYDNMRT
eukprot:c8291_g1_i1.p1 GENE.c8291_g1_i1~~c8291_g1_i1.p1  ORF type:complete len:193 (+),score=13.80 c8291_g1_i1:825-1403(+)